jgi:hypothetical protein
MQIRKRMAAEGAEDFSAFAAGTVEVIYLQRKRGSKLMQEA